MSLCLSVGLKPSLATQVKTALKYEISTAVVNDPQSVVFCVLQRVAKNCSKIRITHVRKKKLN